MKIEEIVSELRKLVGVCNPGYIQKNQSVRDKILQVLNPLHREFLDKYEKNITHAYKKKWPLDKLHWWSRPEEYAFILAQTDSLLNTGKKTICEFGAGCSFLTYIFLKYYKFESYTVIDNDPDVTAFWTKIAIETDKKLITFNTIPRHMKYDVIISTSVIEHMPNPVECIIDLTEKLNHGSRLILTMDIDLSKAGSNGLCQKDVAHLNAISAKAKLVNSQYYIGHPNAILTPCDSWWVDRRDRQGFLNNLKSNFKNIFSWLSKEHKARKICVLKVIFEG